MRIRICTYVYTHVYIYIYIYMYICVHIYIYVHTHIHIYIYDYISIHSCMYIYIYKYLCIADRFPATPRHHTFNLVEGGLDLPEPTFSAGLLVATFSWSAPEGPVKVVSTGFC